MLTYLLEATKNETSIRMSHGHTDETSKLLTNNLRFNENKKYRENNDSREDLTI